MPRARTRCRYGGTCHNFLPCPAHPRGWASSKSEPLPGNWRSLREIVKRQSLLRCHWCGIVDLDGECDHIVPRAEGGSHELPNLVWSCRVCHRSKTQRESKRGNRKRRTT